MDCHAHFPNIGNVRELTPDGDCASLSTHRKKNIWIGSRSELGNGSTSCVRLMDSTNNPEALVVSVNCTGDGEAHLRHIVKGKTDKRRGEKKYER